MAEPREASVDEQEQLVPAWLAGVVLLLLLAVVGTAGWVIRAKMTDTAPKTAADIALAKAEEASRKTPNDLTARLDLAYAYQQAGKYVQAIDSYDKVLAKEPKNPAALYNKGMVYFLLKDDKKAEEILWVLLKDQPTHALAAKALGDYYADKGAYKSLVVAVKPAADARPDMADLQYLMGLAYEKQDHKDWAVGRYRDALKYVPDMKEARDGLKRLGVTP